MEGNPVSFTDPTGEVIPAIVVGGIWTYRAYTTYRYIRAIKAARDLAIVAAAAKVAADASNCPCKKAGGTKENNPPWVESKKGEYEPGFIDAEAGARKWGRRNNVPNAGDIFHDIKKGDRGKPGSKAADDCSVNPDTGDVNNGAGENIGNLGHGA